MGANDPEALPRAGSARKGLRLNAGHER